MPITKKTVADKFAAYLHHEITLAQLVEWPENVLLEGELDAPDAATISLVSKAQEYRAVYDRLANEST